MWCCCTGAVLLYALLLWNLITPAMRMRSFRSGAKQGLFSAGGVLLTFSFLMSLFMHVVIVVALGYHSVYLTTTPILLASSVLFLAKSCVDEEFRTWMLGPKLTHCLISGIFPVTTPRPESKIGNQQEKNARGKMAGNELFFVYLLHLVILILASIFARYEDVYLCNCIVNFSASTVGMILSATASVLSIVTMLSAE